MYTPKEHELVMEMPLSYHWEKGAQKPFLGHRAKLGSEIPQARIINNNPFLSKM